MSLHITVNEGDKKAVASMKLVKKYTSMRYWIMEFMYEDIGSDGSYINAKIPTIMDAFDVLKGKIFTVISEGKYCYVIYNGVACVIFDSVNDEILITSDIIDEDNDNDAVKRAMTLTKGD